MTNKVFVMPKQKGRYRLIVHNREGGLGYRLDVVRSADELTVARAIDLGMLDLVTKLRFLDCPEEQKTRVLDGMVTGAEFVIVPVLLSEGQIEAFIERHT